MPLKTPSFVQSAFAVALKFENKTTNYSAVVQDLENYLSDRKVFAEAIRAQTRLEMQRFMFALPDGKDISRLLDRTPESGLVSKLVFATFHWVQLKVEGSVATRSFELNWRPNSRGV